MKNNQMYISPPPPMYILTIKNITPAYNFEVISGIIIVSESVLIKILDSNKSLS